MKKLYSCNSFILRNEIRSKRLLKRHLKSLIKLKERRITNQNFKHDINVEKYNFRFRDYIKVKAPKVCSFLTNTEEMIKLINRLNSLYLTRTPVFVILNHVESMGDDAIVVLVSILVKFKADKILVNGDFPQNLEVREKLFKSGFVEHIFNTSRRIDDQERFRHYNRCIYTHIAWTKVDARLAYEIINDASKIVLGESMRCQGVQRALIELMQNTNNHADLRTEGEKQWWLSVNYIKSENKVTFSFVDFGIGIFTSLENKQYSSKFYNWRDKVSSILSINSNSDVLKNILNGEIHRTITNKHYRGKGLPGLKEVFDRNQLSNLSIITNNVKADIAENDYKLLNENFNGTFVYWELTQENFNSYGKVNNKG